MKSTSTFLVLVLSWAVLAAFADEEIMDMHMEEGMTEVEPDADEPETITTPSGIMYQDFEVGKGAQPVPGKKVTVHYVGRLQDGKIFDSTMESGPFSFVIGKGQVIKGWDEGLMSMRVGGHRRMWIPSHLAYGKDGAGTVIPPDSDLTFEVELVDVQTPKKEPTNIFMFGSAAFVAVAIVFLAFRAFTATPEPVAPKKSKKRR
mmetsp:Transcript_15126/g.25908  ORF Transcript_15126/g.25908 Transcript_15126/m.25908 type:complete len:203 (+) Transcript_15126:73-681(+)|eukprot:CAMPEP_0196658258 /NCGR_PEP_ID=MMETSP1086-20130531/28459_1 /TAXON_ID=77921 /ORGANISM="Cyanoptyche  gloeocystis , Strain SAG4.97" /LENGTH=202 /DNA_ID=CAMNT_0041991739 /DNA_START=70 /DNA_END=678 /DNA_ORIENTATION=+